MCEDVDFFLHLREVDGPGFVDHLSKVCRLLCSAERLVLQKSVCGGSFLCVSVVGVSGANRIYTDEAAWFSQGRRRSCSMRFFFQSTKGFLEITRVQAWNLSDKSSSLRETCLRSYHVRQIFGGERSLFLKAKTLKSKALLSRAIQQSTTKQEV